MHNALLVNGLNFSARRLRILYMPPVYAVISFFSFRYFRSYTYYDLIETGMLIVGEGG